MTYMCAILSVKETSVGFEAARDKDLMANKQPASITLAGAFRLRL